MNIYSSSTDLLTFSAPYNAKRLLDDSLIRTFRGFDSISKGAVLSGFGNFLLARVESVAASAFVTLSASLLTVCSILFTPVFLIPATVLNLASRIPGISSFESVQNFTRESSDVIYRTLRVNFIALPVIFLFLTATNINTFLPGILKPQNVFNRTIHRMVENLGPLKTTRVVVPGVTSVVGTKSKLSALSAGEEYLRALSSQNYLKTETVSRLYHQYTYSTPR